MEIIPPDYPPELVRCGILHIGVGNFHRAHQQFYLNKLLADADQRDWGICGVCLLPADQALVQRLRAQNLAYTLTVCAADGQTKVYQMSALRELLWGVEQPAAVVEKIADPAIKIITLTITEGGYNIDKATGEFNLDNESVRADLANPAAPQTVFGFVAQGLRARKAASGAPLTMLCCDNLQHNGDTTKKAFLSFMQAQDAELARWAAAHVSFPNSMVDRITPATTPPDVARLNTASGLPDAAPVYCEEFIQWVIEDNFRAGRPALERVGVEFAADVAVYEKMKLSLLNASHTLLSYPAFLMGYRRVDEAMGDAQLGRYLQEFMDLDITPHVPAPPHTDLGQYKQTLLQRFANPAVSDQVARLCADGSSKFPVYIMPNLAKMIRAQQPLARVAFLLAAYRHYLRTQADDHGQPYPLVEPGATAEDTRLIASAEPLDFLDVSAFKQVPLRTVAAFTAPYLASGRAIQELGTAQALAGVLGS